MAFEIQAEEDFTLLQIKEEITPVEVVEITHQLTDGLLDTPYVVVEPFLNEPMKKETWLIWKGLDELVQEHKGVLIFVAGGKEFEQAVTGADLTYIPSYDEAIDYIFMDRLEKELDSEDQS